MSPWRQSSFPVRTNSILSLSLSLSKVLSGCGNTLSPSTGQVKVWWSRYPRSSSQPLRTGRWWMNTSPCTDSERPPPSLLEGVQWG